MATAAVSGLRAWQTPTRVARHRPHPHRPYDACRDRSPLQRPVPLHRQFGPLDHGRGDPQSGRTRQLPGALGRKPAERPSPSIRARFAEKIALRRDRIAVQELDGVFGSGHAEARFRFHRLRQRRERIMPGLAGSADDRALGRTGSRGGYGYGGRNSVRIPRCTAAAYEPHQNFFYPPSARARQAHLAAPTGFDRGSEGFDSVIGRRLVAEGLGTAILVATVVGSGIMAQRLAGGNDAVALLCNTIPTGAILVVLITIFAPVSGAHFNPAVTLSFAAAGMRPWREALPYIVAQCAGGIAGTIVAHLMFDLAPLAIGTTARSGPSQWLAEAGAAFTLLPAFFGGLGHAAAGVSWVVGLTITAAYWFTSSTSFANPAVTLARGFTTTFAGIAIGDVPLFVVAQLLGAALAAAVAALLLD